MNSKRYSTKNGNLRLSATPRRKSSYNIDPALIARGIYRNRETASNTNSISTTEGCKMEMDEGDSKDDLTIFGYNATHNEMATSSEPDSVPGSSHSDALSSSQTSMLYSCDFCEYSTMQTGHLKAHVRIHTGEKPFACDGCEYRATSITNLRRHKLTHSGLKPYTCDVCGHTARSTSNLKVHMRIHTGDRPFRCEICGYCTNDTTKLKRHILKSHTGDKKQFTCDICLFNTDLSSDLKKHMKTHAPARTTEKLYFCHVCDYRANTPTNLKIHLRVHTGEKPYPCLECPYRSRTGPQLTIHMRTHTGEKPYVCKVCGYRTGQSSHLKKHVRRHHPYHQPPDAPEVADFSYVKVGGGGLDDRPTALGFDDTISADVTGGIRVKEEVPDGLEATSHVTTSVDTCDITVGDLEGVMVKEEGMDYFDQRPNDQSTDCRVDSSALCIVDDVNGVKVKEEVMDYGGYAGFENQTGSNEPSRASNVSSTDCRDSNIAISDVTAIGDVNGVKVREEVMDYGGCAGFEHQTASNELSRASNVVSTDCRNSNIAISGVTTIDDVNVVKVKEEVVDYSGYAGFENQTGSNELSKASNVISTDGHDCNRAVSNVTAISDVNGVMIKEEVVAYDYFNDDELLRNSDPV